jgi:hypothetical protein
VLQRHRVGARLLAGDGEALQQPEHHQQHGSGDADLVVGGQAADEERRQAHHHERGDEDLLPAQPVTDVTHDERADGSGQIADPERGQGKQRPGRRRRRREEDLAEDQRGSGAVDEEVVILQSASDPGGKRGLTRLSLHGGLL